MRLEPSNLLGLSCCADGVDSHSNTHLGLDGLHVLIDCQEHARVDGQGDIVQEVVVLASNEGLHVSGSVEHSQQTGEGHIGE